MVRTFYIPEDKRETMMKFVEKAEENGVSYSKLLVSFMEEYINNKN
tara:strand:- start:2085 stop:2222 length:138 start_codon:yes stop_codon:yes gene_type:complete